MVIIHGIHHHFSPPRLFFELVSKHRTSKSKHKSKPKGNNSTPWPVSTSVGKYNQFYACRHVGDEKNVRFQSFASSQGMHGTGMFTYIYHKNQPFMSVNTPFTEHIGLVRVWKEAIFPRFRASGHLRLRGCWNQAETSRISKAPPKVQRTSDFITWQILGVFRPLYPNSQFKFVFYLNCNSLKVRNKPKVQAT